MPYNGSGGYSPPATDFPAVATTLIQSAKFNNVINDIATALSTAITKDGQTTVTANIPFAGFALTNARLRAVDGVLATPGITFNNEVSSGLYRIGAGDVAFAILGAKISEWTATGFAVTGTLTAASYFATGGTAPNGATNGVEIYVNSSNSAPRVSLIDTARTADNHIAHWNWIGGNFSLSFANDANSAAISPITFSGGQAAGITGIASNSGVTAGAWTHTGRFMVAGFDATYNLRFKSATGAMLRIFNDSDGNGIGVSTANNAESLNVPLSFTATSYTFLTGALQVNNSISAVGGFISAAPNSGSAGYFTGGAAGDSLRITPSQTNGNGASIDVVNHAQNDYTPLGLFGFGINFNSRNGVGTTALAGSITATSFTVNGTGPHAIGGATDTRYQFLLQGNFTGASDAIAMRIGAGTMTPAVNGTAGSLYLSSAQTLQKSGSGTHADFYSMLIDAPTIGAGAATLTNATSLKISGAPSVGTNQRALWVAAGLTQLDGAVNIPGPLTYAGVTLNSTTTGTGNLVASASPTFTGTVLASAATFSGAVKGLVQDAGTIATTSGTVQSYTGLPTGIKTMWFKLKGVSTNGTSAIKLQLSTGAAFKTSGYNGGATSSGGTGGADGGASFPLTVNATAAWTYKGVALLTLESSGNNTWTYGALIYAESGVNTPAEFYTCAGDVSLSGVLDGIRIIANGADAFDAGEVGLTYLC